jgi:uncharacterized Ntn-hydrolase superfamily protein
VTFTIAVVDPVRGVLGAASASRSPAVGPAVIGLDPARGIAISQAWTNQHLKGAMLRALGAGHSPEAALADALATDPRPELRQCGLIAADGRLAGHTGTGTTGWAGQRLREPDRGPAGGATASSHDESSLSVLAMGNCLTGPAVLDAMIDRLRPAGTGEDLARALVDALLAGDAEGGDARGRQSAAVVTGRLDPEASWPFVLDADLRIDDSGQAPRELSALVDRWSARAR